MDLAAQFLEIQHIMDPTSSTSSCIHAFLLYILVISSLIELLGATLCAKIAFSA